MFDKGLFYGICSWLRNQDLNLRPSGYEFATDENLISSRTIINKPLVRYCRFYNRINLNQNIHISQKFCQLDKILTKNNCTKNCTDTNLKKLAYLFKWTDLYIAIPYRKLKINIFRYFFTTSRLTARPYLSKSFHSKARFYQAYKDHFTTSRPKKLHIAFLFFYFYFLFFLYLIEKKGCEVVITNLEALFYRLSNSHDLIYQGRAVSREVVK